MLMSGKGGGGGGGKRGLKRETHRFSIVSPEPCVFEAQSIHVSCQSHNEIAGGQRIGQEARGDLWVEERDNPPSISSFLPIVLLHCFPALAILRNRMSPSMGLRFSEGSSRVVEFVTRNVASVAPEKNAWML